MIQICNEHQNKGRAIAFAFILFDFGNPQLWKILDDEKYWLALNEISGEYLTVFSLNYKIKKKQVPRSSVKLTQMLTSISTYYNPSSGTNELIRKYFGSEIQIQYPAILFFQVDDNSVIDSLLIELKEEEIEPSFLELKSYIKKAAETLKKVKGKDKSNRKKIFDQLVRDIKRTKTTVKIKRSLRDGGDILGLISSVIGLF